MERILIVLPAFNEKDTILSVLRDINDLQPGIPILIVNDGSMDGTDAILMENNYDAITVPFNMGVGAALKIAYKYALKEGFTKVVQIDADGQHDPKDISRLIAAAKNYDIVIGSRFLSKEDSRTRSLRVALLKTISKLVSSICSTRITDSTSGFKIVSHETIRFFAKNMPTEYLGDTLEFLVMANKKGFTIGEIPVRMKKRQGGMPSQTTLKSILYLLRATIALFFVSIRKIQDAK